MVVSKENEKIALRDTYDKLVPQVKQYIPEKNLPYIERTNEMHCNPDTPGGSKFKGVDNILQVLGRMSADDLVRRVQAREDDRAALITAGAPENSFLPARKGSDAPVSLSKALYYKVDGIQGELRIDQLKNLLSDAKVVVMREKGTREKGEKSYTPASFTVAVGEKEFPVADFATVIIGRDSDTMEDEIWTIHPGPPIRPAFGDYAWSTDLAGPDDKDGEQGVIVTTVGKLIEAGMAPDDYIKITHGSHNELLAGRRIVREV